MAQGIIVGGILEHADEHGSLLDLEVGGLFAEIDVGGSLDAHGIVEEIEAVEIHIDDLVLGVESLELEGDHPFDRLLHGALEEIG